MCNMTTNGRFYEQGQAMRNSAALLPELINDGIRLLVMAGDTGAFDSFGPLVGPSLKTFYVCLIRLDLQLHSKSPVRVPEFCLMGLWNRVFNIGCRSWNTTTIPSSRLRQFGGGKQQNLV